MAFMEPILTYFAGVEKTRLVSEGWLNDEGTGEALDDFPVGDAWSNSGFKIPAVITLLGPHHLDLFNQNKDLPANCSMKLRLIPNEYAFDLKKHADDAELYRLKIMTTGLFMRSRGNSVFCSRPSSDAPVLAHYSHTSPIVEYTNSAVLFRRLASPSLRWLRATHCSPLRMHLLTSK